MKEQKERIPKISLD